MRCAQLIGVLISDNQCGPWSNWHTVAIFGCADFLRHQCKHGSASRSICRCPL